jgi:HEAT repeat protein
LKHCLNLFLLALLAAMLISPSYGWCPSGPPDPDPPPPDRPDNPDPGDPTPPPGPNPDPVGKGVEGKKKGGASAPSLDIWELWWQANKDQYLVAKELIEVEPVEEAPKDGSVIVNVNRAAKPLVELLKKAMKDNDRNIRMVSAVAIGRTADSNLMQLLQEAIKNDKSEEVVETATMALGIMETTKPVEDLWNVLKDPKGTPMARGFAAIGLGFTRTQAKTEDLIALLNKEQDDQVKAAIAVALGLTGDLKAIPILGKIVTDSSKQASKWFSEQTRSFAATSLGRLKSSQGLEFLLHGTKHKEDEVRRACWLALGEIDTEGDAKKEAARVNALIEGIKKEKDTQAQGFILISLGKTQSSFAAFHLRKQLLDAKQANLKGFAAIGLGLLRDEKAIAALHEGWKEAKLSSLISALTIGFGLSKDKNAVKLIIARLEERKGDRDYQVYAAEALGLMRAREASGQLKDLMERSTNFVQVVRACAIALQMMGENLSVPHLQKLMKEGNNFIVANAALTLGRIGNKDVLKSLIDAYETLPTAFVKQYSIVAMGMIYEQRKVTIFKELSINNNYRARTLVYDHALKIP